MLFLEVNVILLVDTEIILFVALIQVSYNGWGFVCSR